MSILNNDVHGFQISNLNEAYKNLQSTLNDELFEQYKGLMRLYLRSKITKIKFDEDARKLLYSPEQLHLHNMLFMTITFKQISSSSESLGLSPISSGVHQEHALPNDDLIKNLICVAALEQGLEGAENDVTGVVLLAIQTFLKNIITAVLSHTSGYKIRENNFQHSIGTSAPNPWLPNSGNIIDATQESSITICDKKQTFESVARNSLEKAEQQTAFALSYAASSQTAPVNRLTLKCLYETLLHNPHIINNHSIYSVNLERILGQLDCP